MDPAESIATIEAELERGRRLFAAAGTLDDLERAQAAVLGRRSTFGEVQRSLGQLDEASRREVGLRANGAREELLRAVEERRADLRAAESERQIELDRVDVTLPGRKPRPGSLHPLTVVENE